MARIFLTKTLSGLVGADDEAKEALKRWKVGETLACEVKKPRNYHNHKHYFALLHTVFENQERYSVFVNFRKAVELAAGHTEEWIDLDGVVHIEVKSVDYATLDEMEFMDLFGRVMRVCVDNFLRGVDEEELRVQVERYAA